MFPDLCLVHPASSSKPGLVPLLPETPAAQSIINKVNWGKTNQRETEEIKKVSNSEIPNDTGQHPW